MPGSVPRTNAPSATVVTSTLKILVVIVGTPARRRLRRTLGRNTIITRTKKFCSRRGGAEKGGVVSMPSGVISLSAGRWAACLRGVPLPQALLVETRPFGPKADIETNSIRQLFDQLIGKIIAIIQVGSKFIPATNPTRGAPEIKSGEANVTARFPCRQWLACSRGIGSPTIGAWSNGICTGEDHRRALSRLQRRRSTDSRFHREIGHPPLSA